MKKDLKCQGKQRGAWVCKSCHEKKTPEDFRMWTTEKGPRKNHGKAKCDRCWQEEKDAEAKVRHESARLVVKQIR